MATPACAEETQPSSQGKGFAGSVSCRDCHEAEALYSQALGRRDLPRQDRYRLEAKLQALSSTEAGK